MTARLTLVISSLGIGGSERVTTTLANHWCAFGNDVTLLTLHRDERPAFPLDPRVRRIALDVAGDSAGVIEALRNNLRRARTLRSALRASRGDCIVSFGDQTNVLTLLAATGLGIPVVISECVDPRSHPIGRSWEALRHWLYRRANAIHAPAAGILRSFSKRVRTKGRVIPYPVPACLSVAGGERSREGTSVIAAGRLADQKGFDLLLRAFQKVHQRHPQWTLTIFGEGPLRQTLERLRDDLGLTAAVTLPGATRDFESRLHEAQLFVMSSRYEGFPMALCEAMACGLPAIAADCPTGPGEIIRDGVDGILVPAEDIDALAAALDRLIANPGEREVMGRNAIAVSERFSVAAMTRQWESLLQEIVASPPS